MAVALSLAAAQTQTERASDWQAVAKILGRSGSENDGVYRVGLPRSDLRVAAEGIPLRPELTSDSRVAFEQNGPLTTMVMVGKFVLRANELGRVVAQLSKAGLEITAIHNYLAGAGPEVLVVHFEGIGDAAKVAEKLQGTLALLPVPQGAPGLPLPSAGQLEVEAFERILGHKASIAIFRIPRLEEIKCCGAEKDPLLLFSGTHLRAGLGDASRLAQGLHAALELTHHSHLP